MSKSFIQSGLRMALATAAVALLGACTSTVSQVDSNGRTEQPVFPDMAKASHDGSYVNRENLGKIEAGMNKRQIQELIGHPQFAEGMFGVREWDYVLKFRQGAGQPDKVCQYKVLFDTSMLARSFFYQPADCQRPEEPAQVAAKTVVRELSLAADASFGFGSAKLRPEGQAKLDRIASEATASQITAIDIVGHTDRIGSAHANQKLSLERALAVRDYLVRQGMPVARVNVDGLGDAQPLVECQGPVSAKVIECLAPNRRTTITIHSQSEQI